MPKGRPEKNPQICGVYTESAAKLLNIGTRSVESAAAVQKHGIPEVADAVMAGEMSVFA